MVGHGSRESGRRRNLHVWVLKTKREGKIAAEETGRGEQRRNHLGWRERTVEVDGRERSGKGLGFPKLPYLSCLRRTNKDPETLII